MSDTGVKAMWRTRGLEDVAADKVIRVLDFEGRKLTRADKEEAEHRTRST